jgi:MFS family permease
MSAPQVKISYATVLRAPHAARTFGAALIGRLSYGVVFLALVLSVTRSTGSLTVAGVFMALFGLTSAFLSPVRAGFIDRYGMRRALLPMTVVYALLLTVIAETTWRSGAPDVVLWLLGAAAGSFTPPLGPIMRTLWREMLDGDLLQRAYSLDTVAEELLYVTGPLLVGLLTAIADPALGVALSAALVLIGALLLLASPAVPVARERTAPRREEAQPGTPTETAGRTSSRWRRGLAAVRTQPGVVGPVLVSAGVGMCLGAVNLVVVAFAAQHHQVAAVAWVEAALSAGSVLGGLVYGARTWRATPQVRLSLLAAAMGVAVAAAGFSANIVVLTGLMGVAGLFVAPALSTAYLAADEAAPPDARTQAGAWVNTGFNIGDSGGAAGVGVLVARLPLVLCFVVAGASAVLAAVIPLARGGRTPGTSPSDRAAAVSDVAAAVTNERG